VFDVILTNPPFAGEIQERAIIQSFDLGRSRGKIERDVLFLERCVRLLKPGGRMAIVLPHNKLSASAFTDVREWTLRHCHLLAVVGVGRNMFMPHTQQKTGVVVVRKKRSLDENAPNIFFALSEKDGKDSRGNHILLSDKKENATLWQRLDHDLDSIVTEFQKQGA
jgi:type I restriction enzyme M protein